MRRRKYLSSGLLIIEELGFEPMDRHEASLFYRLVSYRYGHGSILITTNNSVRDWPELLAGDEVLSIAILDRLLHRVHVPREGAIDSETPNRRWPGRNPELGSSTRTIDRLSTLPKLTHCQQVYLSPCPVNLRVA